MNYLLLVILYSQDFSYQWAGRTILLSAQLVASWADNRFVHVSFSRNPQKNCNKLIVSDIQSHENNVCDRFVSLEQNSSQLSWETMTYFQPSPLRGLGWKCHCFSLNLQSILFSRDKTDANVLFLTSTLMYRINALCVLIFFRKKSFLCELIWYCAFINF